MSILSEARAGAFATSRRGTVADYAVFILQKRAQGLSVQHIARQIGKSTEDVQRFLHPAPVELSSPAPKVVSRAPEPTIRGGRPAREITDHDVMILRRCERGQISQTMASILMKTSVPTVRRCLERLADMRVGP